MRNEGIACGDDYCRGKLFAPTLSPTFLKN